MSIQTRQEARFLEICEMHHLILCNTSGKYDRLITRESSRLQSTIARTFRSRMYRKLQVMKIDEEGSKRSLCSDYKRIKLGFTGQ